MVFAISQLILRPNYSMTAFELKGKQSMSSKFMGNLLILVFTQLFELYGRYKSNLSDCKFVELAECK